MYKIEIASGGSHLHSGFFFLKTLEEQKAIIEEAAAESARKYPAASIEPCEVRVPALPKEDLKIMPKESEASQEELKMDISPPSLPSIVEPDDEPQEEEQLGYPKLKELSVLNLVDNQYLERVNPNFLGINRLLESYYFEEININQFFQEDKKICQHEDTFQRRDGSNADPECRKHPLHQPFTATKMALSFLAIHGVALDKIGDFFPYLFFSYFCAQIFHIPSYLIYALKWYDPP